MAYGKRKPTRAPVRAAVKPVTKRTVRKAVTTVKAKRFRAAVKDVMLRQLETKHISDTIANEAAINGGGLDHAANPGDGKGFVVANVMNNLRVLYGTMINERVGDRISPTSIFLTGLVSTNSFDTVANMAYRPFAVRIIVFRSVESEELPATLNLKKNDSLVVPTVVPIDGSALNEMLPYGPEFKILASRTYKLRAPDSSGLPTIPGAQRINTQTSNFPWYRRFAIKVPCPKVIKYVGANTTNYWFSVGAYILDANGRVTTGPLDPNQDPNQVRAKLHMRAHMRYKDA